MKISTTQSIRPVSNFSLDLESVTTQAPFLETIKKLATTFQALTEYSDRNVRNMGLTPCQFDVIATLGQTQGMNMRQLAETTLVTKGTLTGIIDRLEKKNLVRREVPEGNRRSFRVVLTEEGEELFKIAFPSQVNYLKQRLGRLSPNDLAQIESALQKLKNVL